MEKVERKFVSGNEAACLGALSAGCRYFFGYPITPQNDVTEWFARELPKVGGVFVQSESENATIAMLYGAAATGVRVMSSTSSPGWSLMQEGMSCAVAAGMPFVIMHVQRGGPGQGAVEHGQMDYLSVTRGGGHGGYKTIVLAPAHTQELCDFMQLAFYLADKYTTPVVLMSDGQMGRVKEMIEIKHLDLGPLPPKDWALTGTATHPGRICSADSAKGSFPVFPYVDYIEQLWEKFQIIEENEVRYEAYEVQDADIVLVAYGYTARVSRVVVEMARAKGIKAGLFRPITLWPFPYKSIRALADGKRKFVAVEDSMGGLVEDVKLAAEGRAEILNVGMTARDVRLTYGIVVPEKVLGQIETWLQGQVS